jgi:hypothetical protein
MKTKGLTLDRLRNAKRESKSIEFKEKFDINQLQDWCEIIKDIVAIANSGGGGILIGIKDDGTPSGWDATPLLNLDPAQITDKIAKYTGEQYADFEIQEIERDGHRCVVLLISPASTPMIFIRPGTYGIGGEKHKTAFGQGVIYFRHGAKSEPGNSKDLRDFIEREIEKIQKSWLGNIRKVVEAPLGSRVNILPPEVSEPPPSTATPIRIVDDPSAPAYHKVDPDQTHPYRLKEVLQRVNEEYGRKVINNYDVLCVRKVHNVENQPNFYYKSRFGPSQYSEAFVNWLVEQFEKDQLFFKKAREKMKKTKGE